MPDYKPGNHESINDYVLRLREIAGEIRGETISQSRVVDLCSTWPKQQQYSRAWLSQLESGNLEWPDPEKLRTLAAVYSDLTGTYIPADWLLAKAGYKIAEPGEWDEVRTLLQRRETLTIVALVAQLLEAGYSEDVRLLIENARRYLALRRPDINPGDIFSDPNLSEHVAGYLDDLGLL